MISDRDAVGRTSFPTAARPEFFTRSRMRSAWSEHLLATRAASTPWPTRTWPYQYASSFGVWHDRCSRPAGRIL